MAVSYVLVLLLFRGYNGYECVTRHKLVPAMEFTETFFVPWLYNGYSCVTNRGLRETVTPSSGLTLNVKKQEAT